MKPTPAQRRILRLFVAERMTAVSLDRLKWLDANADNPIDGFDASPCAFFTFEGGQVSLTDRGRWTARDLAASLARRASSRYHRALAQVQGIGPRYRYRYGMSGGPVRRLARECAVYLQRCGERLVATCAAMEAAHAERAWWEGAVPRPRAEARAAKIVPGYVPKVPLTVCEKHRKVNDG